jgi:hypothetical protein
MKGTDKRFIVRIKADNGYYVRIELDGSLELEGFPKNSMIHLGSSYEGQVHWNSGLNWIVFGDQKMGFYSGQHVGESWMSKFKDTLGPWKLKHICMPGSHDAGMSKLNGQSLANDDNTRNQLLNLNYQLRRGSRYFDLRPVIGNDGKFLAGHYTFVKDGPSPFLVGANGEYIDDMINEINS